MPKQVVKGHFYEFDRARANFEVGAEIARPLALARVSSGKDVYTPGKADAKLLAKDVEPNRPEWNAAGSTGYFPHFHPAGEHPEVLPSGKVEGYGHIFYGQRGEEAPGWGSQSQVAQIGHVVIWSVEDEALFFRAGMQVDADGAPQAYHPGRARGLDNLDNAGKPGNWWSLVTDDGQPSGNPVVQGDGDPAPGFYVSTTALQSLAWPRTDPRRYVDAARVPYFVLPRAVFDRFGVRLGDVGFVLNSQNNLSSYAIYADIGPAHQIGEGSIALAKALRINADPRRGGASDGVIYLVFPRSGNGRPKSPEEIKSVGLRYFLAWGGKARLQSVVAGSQA